MNKLVLGVLLLSIVAVTTVGITNLQNTNADKREPKTIINRCEIDLDTGTCNFDQVFKSKNQDFNVKNEIDASAIATAIANGSGSGGTVDQFARNEAQKANDAVSNLSGVVTQNQEATNFRLDSLQNASNANTATDANQTGEIQKLWEAVNSAIIDVDNGTGTVEPPSGNQSGNQSGGGEIPNPGENQTGGDGGNQSGGNTGNETGTGGNETGGEIPGNNTGFPPITNETDNSTGPIFEGNFSEG